MHMAEWKYIVNGVGAYISQTFVFFFYLNDVYYWKTVVLMFDVNIT